MPANSISTSVRRYFVDKFFYSNLKLIEKKTVVDIGGKKNKKRGFFNVDNHAKSVIYVNIDKQTEPDIIADATNIPLENNSVDTVIMGEVLEHLAEVGDALKEAYRLLKPGGKLIATIPFMLGVHADPHDYGRYTDYYWKYIAEKNNFNVEKIEPQGTIFAVLALMFQHILRSKKVSLRPIQNPTISLLMYFDRKTTNPLLTSWTTGYGIILKK